MHTCVSKHVHHWFIHCLAACSKKHSENTDGICIGISRFVFIKWNWKCRLQIMQPLCTCHNILTARYHRKPTHLWSQCIPTLQYITHIYTGWNCSPYFIILQRHCIILSEHWTVRLKCWIARRTDCYLFIITLGVVNLLPSIQDYHYCCVYCQSCVFVHIQYKHA